jgi:hypothetical protein
MTRNSQNDLLIFQYLFTQYTRFLLERLSQEHTFLKTELENINLSLLSKKDQEYIHEQKIFHYNSTTTFSDFLIKLQKITSNFYETNYTPLPLYSKTSFHINIKNHEEKILQIINELFKY